MTSAEVCERRRALARERIESENVHEFDVPTRRSALPAVNTAGLAGGEH